MFFIHTPINGQLLNHLLIKKIIFIILKIDVLKIYCSKQFNCFLNFSHIDFNFKVKTLHPHLSHLIINLFYFINFNFSLVYLINYLIKQINQTLTIINYLIIFLINAQKKMTIIDPHLINEMKSLPSNSRSQIHKNIKYPLHPHLPFLIIQIRALYLFFFYILSYFYLFFPLIS